MLLSLLLLLLLFILLIYYYYYFIIVVVLFIVISIAYAAIITNRVPSPHGFSLLSFSLPHFSFYFYNAIFQLHYTADKIYPIRFILLGSVSSRLKLLLQAFQ